MSLQRFRGRCVIIEFNPTIPFDTDFINPQGKAWGNSALTITRFARSKGYSLVAMTGMNLVFLDDTEAVRAGIAEIALRPNELDSLERYFWGYDGTLVCMRPGRGATAPELFRVPWHQYMAAQPMPKFLRTWHLGRQSWGLEVAVSSLSLIVLRPGALVRYGWSRLMRRIVALTPMLSRRRRQRG
jgi:hypothetical protein